MNTRFHAKRVEELAQTKAAHAEGLAAKTRIARIQQAYPEATGSGDGESSSPTIETTMSDSPSPSAVFAPQATELEQPLLPLNGNGGYGTPLTYSADPSADFAPEYSGLDYYDSELTPSILAHFSKPSDDPSTLVDYQDFDQFDTRRRRSLLYGLQREPQEPLNFTRWSQYDPTENTETFADDMPAASGSVSETATSPRSMANARPAMPMSNFLIDRASLGHESTISSMDSKGTFNANSMSSTSTGATSFSDNQSPHISRQLSGPRRRSLPPVTPLTSLPRQEHARTLFEPYVAAAQHLQSVKTDTLAFQDSEKLQRLLREPPQTALFAENFNNQFLWFFNNNYGTPSAKVGYDHCYAQTNREFQERAFKYEREHSKQRTNREYRPLDEMASYMVLRILRDAPRELFEDPTMIDYYMHIAWRQTSAVHYIVHLPTFDPSHSHPTLLATFVVMGMAMSGDPQASLAAKTLYPSVLMATYESVLDAAASAGGDRHATPNIGQLQAFTLLMRYEQLILGADASRLSLLHGPTSSAMVDRFLWVMLSFVHHWNGPQTPIWSTGVNQRPLWATVGPESYSFHPHCVPKLQWREWARYEMAKRTFHLALFCDNMHCLGAGSENLRPVSIFNMDTHMICHEWLWDAWSEEEFFQIVGPTRVIPCMPYLGLIKSLIRFPRIATTSANHRRAEPERPRGTPPLWSLFSLRVLAYGLTNIVGRLTGVSEHGEQLVQQVFSSDYMAGSKETPMALVSPWVSPLFDRSIQSRLYRGLDLWLQYFEDTYGKVTERIFAIAGAVANSANPSNQLNEDLAMIDLDDAQEGVPGYVFVVVFYHYSSFLFVHEDLPIVLQVASNVKSWLEVPAPVAYSNLLDKLCIPLYMQWLQSNEAQAMVSTSCLCLVWLNASMGRLPVKLFNNQFLASSTFIAVLVVWLHDLTRGNNAPLTVPPQKLPPLVLENYRFVLDAVAHLQTLSNVTHENSVVENSGSSLEDTNAEIPGDKIRSVILLAECLLYHRPNSDRLVTFLMRLLEIMDPRLTIPTQQAVLSGSRRFFASRQA